MGLAVDKVAAERFEIRVSKEVLSYVKHGGRPEEALLGLALAAASLMSDEEKPDIRNKYMVKAREGGVSFSVLQRVLTNDDALNLAAHMALAAGDVGPQVLRRMALLMEERRFEP